MLDFAVMILNLTMALTGRVVLEESGVVVFKIQMSYLYVGCIHVWLHTHYIHNHIYIAHSSPFSNN